MKKQIFAFVLVTFFLSFSNVYADVNCPTPRPIDQTCLGADALHPVAGTPYDYTVNVPTPPGTKEYTWFVTQNQSFIALGVLNTAAAETTAGSFLAATGTGYNNPATGTATLSLTWKSFVYDPTQPVFVVIQVRNTTTPATCDINNLKVYKIQPVNSFSLDIANVGADKTTVSAYDTSIDVCLPNVVSAVYVPTDDKVRMDFGTQYLYFVVTAANFSTSWRPSVTLTGVDAQETITAVEWFRPNDAAFATPEPMPLTAGVYTATNPVLALAASGTVGTAGECIVIRVSIDHTVAPLMYEGLTDETITLAVDGKTQLALATPLGDVHYSSTLPSPNAFCGKEDGFQFDTATQVIKARPDVQAVTPTPFLLIEP